MIHSVDETITEENVLEKTPGDIDVIDILTKLGFISPRNTEKAKKLEEAVMKKLTSDSSLHTSPNVQD